MLIPQYNLMLIRRDTDQLVELYCRTIWLSQELVATYGDNPEKLNHILTDL